MVVGVRLWGAIIPVVAKWSHMLVLSAGCFPVPKVTGVFSVAGMPIGVLTTGSPGAIAANEETFLDTYLGAVFANSGPFTLTIFVWSYIDASDVLRHIEQTVVTVNPITDTEINDVVYFKLSRMTANEVTELATDY